MVGLTPVTPGEITRADLLLWIEPDQNPQFGVFDWSPAQLPTTVFGPPTFTTDQLEFDGVGDRLVIADALDPSAHAGGFTIVMVLRCPAELPVGTVLCSIDPDNGAGPTECIVGAGGSIVARLACTSAGGIVQTPTGPGSTRLPVTAEFPAAADEIYLAAVRWSPDNGGTLSASLVRSGDSAAQVAASTTAAVGLGAPEPDTSVITVAADPPVFSAWNLLRLACTDRALTDAELAALVAEDAPTSFITLPLSEAEGFVDHTDLARLDPTRFQAAVTLALTRNVHIVVGPGESHCGTGGLAQGSQPGIDNLLNHACGRAVGLAGCGLTTFKALPMNLAMFSSVHHLPFNASSVVPAWAPVNGTNEPTIGIWDTLGDSSMRKSVQVPNARSTIHLQRQAILPGAKSTVGIAAIIGLANLWELVDEHLGTASVYANGGSATGQYRFSTLPAGGDYHNIADWTTDGPAFAVPPDETMVVRRVTLDPDAIGFAVENIGGLGQGVRLAGFDVDSPTPGVRIGCSSLAIGGGRVAQINQDVWFQLMQLARIDYVGLCLSITNDSSKSVPYSAWWHDVQTIARICAAMHGPDGTGGQGRTWGIWIPVEGNLIPANRVRQRIMADLLASLAVDLNVDLVSFPAFVPTHASGATTLYDGVHIAAPAFWAVASLFEAHVMPWDVPDPTGACCFACGQIVPPCPSAAPLGEPCVEATRPECEEVLRGVYRGDGTACDQSPCPCPGDINGDGATSSVDFTILAASFGLNTTECLTRAQGDLNCDGAVTVSDFTVLAGDYGCE